MIEYKIPFKDFTFEEFLRCHKNTKNSTIKKEKLFQIFEMYSFIRNNLNHFKFFPQPYNCFYVSDPSPREIFAPNFIDRIMQHYIVDKISDIQNNFIEDNFANRAEKGTHKAILKAQYYMRQIPQRDCYYMQCDIQSYFASIDKNILWKIVTKSIRPIFENKDEEFKEVLYILNRYIYQDPTHNVIFTGNKYLLKNIPAEKSMFGDNKKHKGLTIGAYLNQLLSSLYLDILDKFIKYTLKIKRYVRYVDDFVIFSNNKSDFKQYKIEISNFLRDNLNLTLHPKKTKIQNITKGLNFLGYIIRPHYILVRKRTINSLKNRLRFFNYILNPENYDEKKILKYYPTMKISKYLHKEQIIKGDKPTKYLLKAMIQTINSYYGIFSFANSYNLRVSIYHKHFNDLKEYFYPKNSFGSFGFIKQGY